MTKADVKLVPVLPETECNGCEIKASFSPWYRLELMVKTGSAQGCEALQTVHLFFCPSCADLIGLKETRILYYLGTAGLQREQETKTVQWLIQRALELQSEYDAGAAALYYSRSGRNGEWTRRDEEDFLRAQEDVRGLVSNLDLSRCVGFIDGETQWKVVFKSDASLEPLPDSDRSTLEPT